MIWYMIWYDMIWYMIWYDMIWYDMIWYDMIWYNNNTNTSISSAKTELCQTWSGLHEFCSGQLPSSFVLLRTLHPLLRFCCFFCKGHCATSRKVAGSIPNDVSIIFHWRNPSGRTVAMESTQSLTIMTTRNISWGVKAVGA